MPISLLNDPAFSPIPSYPTESRPLSPAVLLQTDERNQRALPKQTTFMWTAVILTSLLVLGVAATQFDPFFAIALVITALFIYLIFTTSATHFESPHRHSRAPLVVNVLPRVVDVLPPAPYTAEDRGSAHPSSGLVSAGGRIVPNSGAGAPSAPSSQVRRRERAVSPPPPSSGVRIPPGSGIS